MTSWALYRPANDPQTANDSHIVQQISDPGPELILSQEVRNAVDSLKSLWIDK